MENLLLVWVMIVGTMIAGKLIYRWKAPKQSVEWQNEKVVGPV